MPNWVYNRMTIHASRSQQASIKASVAGGQEVISFQKIKPRPADQEGDWYNWNIANWGTKWDADDAAIVDETDELVTYAFATAWSPPLGVLEAFVNQHMDLDIDFTYEEEQGWGGVMEIRQGKLVKSDEYDIPDSHAEMLRRGNSCFCSPGDPAWFADCFYEQAKERGVVDANVLEAVKGLGAGWSGDLDELIHAAQHL